MKPWREIAVPHKDVLEGTFQQSEFAADITAVHTGKAAVGYQDAVTFFMRTFITEGMRLLLTSVAKRLNGQGGDPVIQLQTAFGGGKTHTMLAVYHLATRQASLDELQGIPDLLDKAGLMDIPRARVAVLDGTAHSPGQRWKRGSHQIGTLWGELAWQLGGEEGYQLLQESDAKGTSPGKNVLQTLLERYAPCVILVDELVAYMRQFHDGAKLTGGTYDSNLSFIQGLTEAAKLVPTAIILGSLPESELEAGSSVGTGTLLALEKYFARVQALWKPVEKEEAFEIVRRRLFEPIHDLNARDEVCRNFANTYISEGNKLPSETQETNYYDRLQKAYPIHPELFQRLYEDWSTLPGFQRTRGVLKLMAQVIHTLWRDQNKDYVILPGSLPLYHGAPRNELVSYLSAGWDAVIDKDVDGPHAETTSLENREPRFGEFNAARRVARSIFLGSAPSVGGGKEGNKGIDRSRILLGCLQPGQSSSTFSDALNRLSDRLHYLNHGGDKSQDSTRFWFDTRANLRREMEERKNRFEDKSEVRNQIQQTLERIIRGSSLFEGVHVFTSHKDVPDDSALRLVVLPPEAFHSRQETRVANDVVLEILKQNGTKPRHRGNRLLFLAADHSTLGRLKDCAKSVLAWNSIVEDVKDGRLNVDRLQEQQAKKELAIAEEVLPKAVRECYKWILCPSQYKPTDRLVSIESFALNTSGSNFSSEVERVCLENELVIQVWSPVHLRNKLQELYWKEEKPSIRAMAFWDDCQKFVFLPRLKSRQTLEQAIIKGCDSKDFFGTAFAETENGYEGFGLGNRNVQLDDSLLLIELGAAKAYAEALEIKEAARYQAEQAQDEKNRCQEVPTSTQQTTSVAPNSAAAPTSLFVPSSPQSGSTSSPTTQMPAAPVAALFNATADINASMAKIKMIELADEIISLLSRDPNAEVKVSVEISAEFPQGVSDQIKRGINENARALRLRFSDWSHEHD